MYQELLDKQKCLKENVEEAKKNLQRAQITLHKFQRQEFSKAFVALMKERGVNKIRLVTCWNQDQDNYGTFADNDLWFQENGYDFGFFSYRFLAMRIGESDDLEVMSQAMLEDYGDWQYSDDIQSWRKLTDIWKLDDNSLDKIFTTLLDTSNNEFPWVKTGECKPIPGFDEEDDDDCEECKADDECEPTKGAGPRFKYNKHALDNTIFSYRGAEYSLSSVFPRDFVIENNVLVKGVNSPKVRIPEGVTEIADEAFQDCYKLQSVVIPKTVKKIGSNAFNTCVNLQKINIPDGITEINYGTFGLCFSLNTLELPDSIKSISEEAFKFCYDLEDINVPASLEYIGSCAFADCVAMKNKDAFKKVKVVEDNAFDVSGL